MDKGIRGMSNFFHRIVSMRALYILVIFLILSLQVAQRFFNSGLIGGLDYFLFQPDGVFYSIKTFEFLGYSNSRATVLVQDFYNSHSKIVDYSFIEDQFQQSLMSSRILYPIASAPFVSIFGMWGMLFIPIACTLLVPIHLVNTLINKGCSYVAVIATVAMLSLSSTYTRWTILNYTEALNLAIFYCIIVIIDAKLRPSTQRDLMMVFLFGLMGLNHAEPFLVLFFALWAIYKRLFRNPILTIGAIISSNLAPFFIAGVPMLGFKTSPQNFSDFLINFIRIPILDIAQLAILDRALCILILLSLISLKSKYSPNLSLTLLPYLMLAFTLQTIFIGAVGTNFRYFILVVPLLLTGFARVIDAKLKVSL
jgi:hypothetical protein